MTTKILTATQEPREPVIEPNLFDNDADEDDDEDDDDETDDTPPLAAALPRPRTTLHSFYTKKTTK